jgi:uncharacterized protein with LGFP repeats
MEHVITRAPRPGQVHAQPARPRMPRHHQPVSWSDFRTAVRYDPTSRLLLAVPEISAKRAQNPWLGDAVALHVRVGDAEVYRRDYEHGTIYWSPRHGTAVVHGMVRDIWALFGWERSPLGLPVADVQFDAATEEFSGCFERGSITWSPAGGPVVTVLPRG